jgi:hypothetical protein
LLHCLRRRGEKVSVEQVMGLSGESFRLFFNRQDPDQGVYVVAHNPLRAASSALGYDPNVLSATDFAPAVEQLRQSLEEGKGPPILHGRLDWVVVESYDPASGEYGPAAEGSVGRRPSCARTGSPRPACSNLD